MTNLLLDLHPSLGEFLLGKDRNAWLNSPMISVYVRISKRYLNLKKYDCLDIANISQSEEYTGKGLFSQFMKQALKPNRIYAAIFVENILNPNLVAILLKYEFTLLAAAGGAAVLLWLAWLWAGGL